MAKVLSKTNAMILFPPVCGLAQTPLAANSFPWKSWNASGENVKINGQPVVVEGDEKSVKSSSFPYTLAPPMVAGVPTPGSGHYEIQSIFDNGVSKKLKINDKRVILECSIEVKFIVDFPYVEVNAATGVTFTDTKGKAYRGGFGSILMPDPYLKSINIQ